MTCARSFLTSAALGAACTTLVASPLAAQAPVPTLPGSPVVPSTLSQPYRAPVITLVQPTMPPAGTGSVPLDRPAVVFRFAAGEPDDPLDGRSLTIAVDGIDRTALFQTAATHAGGQAWGPLAPPEAVKRGELAIGAHRVAARVCSARGACSTAEAQVLVLPGLAASARNEAAAPKGVRQRLLDAVLSVTRKLLLP